MNFFAYVKNNPALYVDPKGKWWEIIVPPVVVCGLAAYCLFGFQSCMENCIGVVKPNDPDFNKKYAKCLKQCIHYIEWCHLPDYIPFPH